METQYLKGIGLCIGYAMKNGARIRAFLIFELE
jgi:hypothetical protein